MTLGICVTVSIFQKLSNNFERNGYILTRRQAIILTNDCIVYYRMYMPLSIDMLTACTIDIMLP